MGVKERYFYGASVVALAAAVAFGAMWDRQTRAGAAPGAPALTDESVQDSYSDALDVVASNYAGPYEVEGANKYAIQGMLRTLDPHSTFFDAREFGELRNEQQSQLVGIGVTINQRNDRVFILSAVPGTPAEKAGLRYGDAIVEIDGRPVRDWSYQQVVGGVRGELGKPLDITVERLGVPNPITFHIVRETMPLPTIRNHFMVDQSVGYVGLTAGFSSTTDAELARAVADLKTQGMQQLVLDLRRNPGGLLDEAVKVAQRFLPAGQKILVVRARDGGSREERTYTSKNDAPETMPLVVLIDSNTASASEVVTGALQDHDRALVVGDTSFGKGLVQTVFDLNFETGLTLTTAKYYTPTGRSIQRDYSKTSIYDYYLHRTSQPGDEPQGEAVLTDLGRRVYGGGGITPDVKIPDPAPSSVRGHLFGATFDFARYLVAGQLPGLREYRVETVDYDHKLRADEFRLPDKVVDAFRQFVAQRTAEFPVSDAQITANLDYVRDRIREELITASYGAEAGNEFYVLNDAATQRAVESLPQARQLAENRRALSDRQ
jgi:carboxyl-terminal processing protease